MKSTCVKQWTDYFKDLKIKEWKKENIGFEKGKSDTLKEQLKVKLGTLSRPLEKQLTNTSLEKLNELTLNIFNVTNEEDVLRIIN